MSDSVFTSLNVQWPWRKPLGWTEHQKEGECQGLEALLLMFDMSACESVEEERVTEWSQPQSLPSQGVSRRGHDWGGGWADGWGGGRCRHNMYDKEEGGTWERL